MEPRFKKWVSLLLSFLLAVSLFSPFILRAAYDQSSAQNYLLAQQSSPWVTMALSASGASGIQSDYLKSISANGAIDYEAPILAITSLNQDPRSFGNLDYVAGLESFYSAGQIGDPSLLNDDFFGILALVSAGVPSTQQIIVNSKNFILSRQNSDGGWSWSVSGSSDSNDTAAAIIALTAADVSPSDSHIQSALTYLKTTQGIDGGFMYDPNANTTDSSSASWVIWALRAVFIDPATWTKNGQSPVDYISSYQTAGGWFKWKATDTAQSPPSVTANAVIALSGKTFPIKAAPAFEASQTFPFRIEGSNQSVCEGHAPGLTALDIVKNASQICGFTYNIQSTSYGPYLNIIGNDTAGGLQGWLYFVNNASPLVGANNYILQPNDQVLWAFGGFDIQPTRLILSFAQDKLLTRGVADDMWQANSGQAVTATVEYYNGSAWQPLAGADVLYGALSAITDSNGQATINAPDGYYKIYAQKIGFVRNAASLLKIGRGGSSTVSLTANITQGDVKGTTTPDILAFTVSPSSVDFGTISEGISAIKTLTFTNTGSIDIKINAQTGGDPLFTDYLALNQTSWRVFRMDLPKNSNADAEAKIIIPDNIKLTNGQKNGQIIFWANAK